MSETRKRSGKETRRSVHEVPRKAPKLHGIAENLYTLQQDLAIAGRIQNRLLPPCPELPGYDFGMCYRPAGEVGGDFYDFIPMEGGRLGILVADASGKGLAGALLMVEARAIIRAMATVSTSPREILELVNRVLVRDLERGTFVTIFFALLDPAKRTLTMANAGHCPLLVCTDARKEILRCQPKGLILGLASEAQFANSLAEEVVELKPGDRFALYSDGVSELMNPVSEEFGMERLQTWLRVNAHLHSDEVVGSLKQALELHQAGQMQSDDITFVTGRFDPGA